MAKCEEMGALTQWKWHRMRRAFLRIESSLLACDSKYHYCRRREDPDTIVEVLASRCHSPESADSRFVPTTTSESGQVGPSRYLRSAKQHRLQVSAKERSKCMHALSRTENQAGHKSPSNSPAIFMGSSSYQQTTVEKAYRAECPVQTEGSQNGIIDRRLLTFSIR
jgi:hypothetical protein